MSESKHITLKVKGMTCGQCEKTIQTVLLKTKGVSQALVSFQDSTAQITYDAQVTSVEKLQQVIEAAGYEIDVRSKDGKDHTESLTGNRKGTLTPLQIAGVGILMAALYLLITKTVGFNFIPELKSSMSYTMLFVVGLLTSLHCIAMCGGINLSQCLKPQKDGTFTAGWQPSLLYNSGRVISYTVVGGIVGGLGSVVSFSGGARGLVALLAGAFMIIMGINMLGVFPGLRRFQINMPAGLRMRLMGKGGKGPLMVGLLNGLMPCGPLQAMQLYALGTGSIAAGALSMFFFSLGTVPLMFGLGFVSTLLGKRFTKNMLRFSAVLVILLGVVMMQRGLNLSGTSAYTLPNGNSTVESAQATTIPPSGILATMGSSVQTVKGEVTPSSYPEIVVQKGVPVSFNLHVGPQSLSGCNSSIVIPDFNIQKGLQVGDNVVTFTPDKVGTYGYSCGMGMITSQITVVDSLNKAK